MPLVEVTAFERRFADDAKCAELIERVTDALVATYGEEVREETWVVLTGVAPERWGFGGGRRT
jgi:4-oxalocrotonate tautomerase